MLVMGKQISKTFVEIADGVRQGITNKLKHKKRVIGAKSINTHLEVQGKEILENTNLITILWI